MTISLLLLLTLWGSATASAQAFIYPDPVPATAEIPQTSLQRGIDKSTDIISFAMPVATLAGVLIARDWEGLKQGALAGVTAAGATLILKYCITEERPNRRNLHSFPSGHTMVAFTTAAFLQRRYGWKLGAPAYALAAWVGVGRVWSKEHHWWDAVAGAAIGAASAYIYTRPWAREHSLAIAPYVAPPSVSPMIPMTVTSTVPDLGLTASFTF